MSSIVETLVESGEAERLSAEDLLGAVLERFHPNVALACSFQKEESVLLDMLFAIEPRARVFAIDTHYLFPETYELWREVEERYYHDRRGVRGAEPRRARGDPRRGPLGAQADLYLAIAKVEPLARALGGLDCWITGVRREQSPTRAAAPKLGWDERNELWKANPLADWTDDDVWKYVRERGLPYNELHDRGYGSIGDTHSTIPGAGREGRWADTDRNECGLHG